MGTGSSMVSMCQVRRLLYMFGAATQAELKGFLDTFSIDTDGRKGGNQSGLG